jgi:hypothetical protein
MPRDSPVKSVDISEGLKFDTIVLRCSKVHAAYWKSFDASLIPSPARSM